MKMVLLRSPETGCAKEYLTLLGESIHTFENDAYLIGIVDTQLRLYIRSSSDNEVRKSPQLDQRGMFLTEED